MAGSGSPVLHVGIAPLLRELIVDGQEHREVGARLTHPVRTEAERRRASSCIVLVHSC